MLEKFGKFIYSPLESLIHQCTGRPYKNKSNSTNNNHKLRNCSRVSTESAVSNEDENKTQNTTNLVPQNQNSNHIERTAQNYDHFYNPKDGKASHYDQLYLDKTLVRHERLMIKAALRSLEIARKDSNKKGAIDLRVLSYGCGDGRHRHVITKLANFLENKKVKVNIQLVGVDISQAAIDSYESKLKKEYRDTQKNPDKDNWYKKRSYAKVLPPSFIVPKSDESTKSIARKIGETNVAWCMFGVLSYLPTRDERVSLLKLIKQQTKGVTLVTVPGPRVMQKEQRRMQELREKSLSTGRAVNIGDVEYERDGVPNKLFYHIYQSSEEFAKELTDAGFVTQIINANTIHERILIQEPNLAKFDALFSKMVSNSNQKELVDQTSSYYGAVSYHNRAHQYSGNDADLCAQYEREIQYMPNISL